MTKARILVADDHEMVRKGLRATLESAGHEVVGEAATGREAVTMARKLAPHVIILDVSMLDLNGLEAARQITTEKPGSEVLILTQHDSEQMIRDVLAAGARGYLLKSDLARDIVAAVASLLDHKPFFNQRVQEVVLSGFLGKAQTAPVSAADEPPPSRLTPREREVVQLIAEGHSTKQIAGKLAISVKTVETHRAQIMDRLDIRHVPGLVRYAIRTGISPSDT